MVFGLQLISKDDAVAQPGVDDDYGDDKERMVTNMMVRRRLVMISEEWTNLPSASSIDFITASTIAGDMNV